MLSDAVLIALIGGPVVVIMTTVVNRMMSRQSDRMSILERASSARKTDLDVLRGIIDELQEQAVRLRASVIVRDGQIGALRKELIDLQDQIVVMRNGDHT